MKTTIELLNVLQGNHDLKDTLKEIPDITFKEYLNHLLDKYDTTIAKVALKTNLDRTYTYQIFEGKRMPSKDKVILLGLGLKADLDDTNRLLALSNNGMLYPKVKRDSILIYGISHDYNVFQINELLEEYGLDILK